jgi:hypothetical protein
MNKMLAVRTVHKHPKWMFWKKDTTIDYVLCHMPRAEMNKLQSMPNQFAATPTYWSGEYPEDFTLWPHPDKDYEIVEI